MILKIGKSLKRYMKKKKLNCIIVGLGSIGMMYDYHLRGKSILTHSTSILKSRNFNLICAIDTDRNKRTLFEKKFKLKTYDNIDKIDEKEIDLLILSSPYETHFSLMKMILKKLKVKVILCEKPFTDNLKNAKKIKSSIGNKKVKIFINYSRISDTASYSIRKEILNKKNIFGKVFYSKSLLNNCSHFINLFNFFFGIPKEIRIISKKKNIFRLRYKNAIVDFYKKNQFRSNNFFLYNDKFRLEYRIKNNHILLKKGNKRKRIRSCGKNINFYVIKNLERYFDNKKYKLCDIDKAIDTHKILSKLKVLN